MSFILRYLRQNRLKMTLRNIVSMIEVCFYYSFLLVVLPRYAGSQSKKIRRRKNQTNEKIVHVILWNHARRVVFIVLNFHLILLNFKALRKPTIYIVARVCYEVKGKVCVVCIGVSFAGQSEIDFCIIKSRRN